MSNKFQCTKLINGYLGGRRIADALHLFARMSDRDVVSWNSMIAGCLGCGETRLAHNLFSKMPERNVISWTTVVDGLSKSGRVDLAEDLFLRMPCKDQAAWNSMISGYCSNGRIDQAVGLFRRMSCPNVISWSAIIAGLDQNDRSQQALSMFGEMLSTHHPYLIQPTSDTFSSVLTACASCADLLLGIQIHGRLTKSGYISDAFALTSLITLYTNCKQMVSSYKMLREDASRSTVASWTAVITGYGSNGEHRAAVQVFHEMRNTTCILPNQSTFTSTLKSCGGLEDLFEGTSIHGEAVKLGFGTDVFVGNSLIFMYSKCGDIENALKVFEELFERNLVSWNTIITGCAHNSRVLKSLALYKDMILTLLQPDEITYLGLLTACSHSKLVENARYFYRLLSRDANVCLRREHCICMVDVLCRSGNLEEAEKLIINTEEFKADVPIWLSLLSSCRMYSNATDLAMRAADHIFDVEPDCSAAYVLLSNIYASFGRWDDVAQIRIMMKTSGLSKIPGCSEIGRTNSSAMSISAMS